MAGERPHIRFRDGKPFCTTADVTIHCFEPLLKLIRLPQICFHDPRHAPTIQERQPQIVSEILGYTTIAIALDTYNHVLPNTQSEATAMEDALS